MNLDEKWVSNGTLNRDVHGIHEKCSWKSSRTKNKSYKFEIERGKNLGIKLPLSERKWSILVKKWINILTKPKPSLFAAPF